MGFLDYFKKKQNTILPSITEWKYKDQVEPIFRDKNNNVFYQLKDPAQISMKRATAANVATRYAEFCLSKETLQKLFTLMREYANTGDFVSVFALVGEIETRLEYAGEEQTLLSLATCYFFVENEDISLYIPSVQERKIAMWREDEEALDFFLNMAWRRTKQYENMSIADITPYLRAMGNPLQSPSSTFLNTQ